MSHSHHPNSFHPFLNFLGSPTIRIDGRDVDREARDATDFGLRCRIYMIDGKPSGLPSKDMIREAIRKAGVQRI